MVNRYLNLCNSLFIKVKYKKNYSAFCLFGINVFIDVNVCMIVCIYVYMYVCMYICMHAGNNVSMHECMHICMYVFACFSIMTL